MIMQVYKYTFTKTALKLTKSYINFMRRPCIGIEISCVLVRFGLLVWCVSLDFHADDLFASHAAFDDVIGHDRVVYRAEHRDDDIACFEGHIA